MSYHLHLRAVPTDELQADFTWLTEFFSAAWDNHPEEAAAGIAESVEKDFFAVHHFYTGAADHPGGTDEPKTLPIEGGELISHPTDERPPFLILNPPAVQRASEFLLAASFDALWQAAGAELSAPFQGWDQDQVREIFLDYHRDLRAFYAKASDAGHAVAKCFWY